jgi:hypothetical protein
MPESQSVQVLTLAPGRQAAVDRFLARVARLTSAEWGRLDAIGERFLSGDPIARWRRAERITMLAARLPQLARTLAVLGFGTELVRDAVGRDALGRDALGRLRGVRRPADAPPGAHALARRTIPDAQALWDVAEAQPGGGRSAYACLKLALVALQLRDRLPAEAFTAWYELVEPVIPAASVDR